MFQEQEIKRSVKTDDNIIEVNNDKQKNVKKRKIKILFGTQTGKSKVYFYITFSTVVCNIQNNIQLDEGGQFSVEIDLMKTFRKLHVDSIL